MSTKAAIVTVPDSSDVYLIRVNVSGVIVQRGMVGAGRQFVSCAAMRLNASDYPEMAFLEVAGVWDFDLIDDLIAAFDCSADDSSFWLLETNEERTAAQPSAHA